MTAVRSFEALGFDPAPGDVALTGNAARSVRSVVDAMAQVEGLLVGERDGQWIGQAADAFRSTVADELTPRVREALSSFADAAGALTHWVGQLEGFQGRARRLEERAQDAAAQLRVAESSLGTLPHPAHVPPEQATAAAHNRIQAEGRVDTASGVLSGILSEANALRDEVDAAAGDTARRLDSSASAAPDEPGLLDRIGGVLSDIGSAIADGFDWFMENVAPILDQLLPVIIFALAIAATFGTGGLAAPLLVLAGLAIGIDTAQAIRGEGSWGDVAIGVAGLAAGGALGKIAGRFAQMHGNAFRVQLGGPGLRAAGGGIVPGSAAAAIRFHPGMANIGAMGWATAKATDLAREIPPAWRPEPQERRR